MKKVIMTGATGFIGYYLLKELVENQIDVWVICRKENHFFEELIQSTKIHVVKCELSEIKKLPNICSERNFDVFFHLAWEGASGALRNDYNLQMKNAIWTCECIEVAQTMLCSKIVITGTICENQVNQIIADKLYTPSSYYLMAKKYAHEMADVFSFKTDMKMIWCQFYHPVGVFNKKNQIIAGTISKLLNHERLIFGLASELFDIIDVSDLAHAIYIMGEKEMHKNLYMIGSNNPQTLKYYLETLKDIIRPDANMEYGALSTMNLIMQREWLDSSDFELETGFKPQINFFKSVRNMKNWLENESEYDAQKWLFIK